MSLVLKTYKGSNGANFEIGPGAAVALNLLSLVDAPPRNSMDRASLVASWEREFCKVKLASAQKLADLLDERFNFLAVRKPYSLVLALFILNPSNLNCAKRLSDVTLEIQESAQASQRIFKMHVNYALDVAKGFGFVDIKLDPANRGVRKVSASNGLLCTSDLGRRLAHVFEHGGDNSTREFLRAINS